jgi:hypothetical protein
VEEFLTELGVAFETGVRILDRKEIDIYIPGSKLGIEINGLFWHSSAAGKSVAYHLEKTEEAEALGIRLLHLFEDDLVYHWEVVKSMLRVRLNLGTKIGARSCVLESIPKQEARDFVNRNHIRGSARFEFAIGLRSRTGELLCVGTFSKPRYSKIADLELIRFCSAQNIVVVGGLSKILKALPPVKLLSYADRSYSTGDVYIRAGFKLVKTNPPTCWYFRAPQNVRTHHTQLRKYKLLRADPTLDSTKTERQLIEEAGWEQIWDCGQHVFVLDLQNKSVETIVK